MGVKIYRPALVLFCGWILTSNSFVWRYMEVICIRAKMMSFSR